MTSDKPNILFEIGEKKTAFDIVGEMHEHQRSKHFCEIVLLPISGVITIFHSEYCAEENNRFSVVVDGCKMTISHRHIPRRFEQLLQLIRQSFPGIGFQSIMIENRANTMEIYVLHK